MTRVRLLTGAVVGMAVLILIGLIVLVVGIVYKAGVADSPETTAPQGEAAPAAAGELRTDPVSLGLPAESIVLRMTNIRGGLAVLVRLPSGEQVIYAVPIDRRQPPLRIQVTRPRGGN